jgi:fumarate hydratase class II
MLGTALLPQIGYQDAMYIAKDTDASGSALREAVLRSRMAAETRYDVIIAPT